MFFLTRQKEIKEALDLASPEIPLSTIRSLRAYIHKKNNIPEYLNPLNIHPKPKRDEYPKANFISFTKIL